MKIDNDLIIQIITIVAPILSSLIIGFLSRYENVFNTRKIKKYEIKDYQYTVILYQAIFTIINPILFTTGFFMTCWVAIKVETENTMQIIFLIEIYIIFLIVILVIEAEKLNNKRTKLQIISSSISEEAEKVILNVDNKKNYYYWANMIIFYIVWIIVTFNSSNKEINLIIIIIEIIYYVISVILMLRRVSKYKTKAIIKSKTIIRMNYIKEHGCYCNRVIKKEFSFKIENDNIIIYYPGEISSCTIKQDNLISIDVGYRIEYNNK